MLDGRSIVLFLVDGNPSGLVTAEIVNWSGHLVAAPRTRIQEVLAREEAGRTGVYFLVGDDDAGRPKVYIGEGDSIADRVRAHAKDPDKEFWERVCFVTSKDLNLTKSHIRYLESRLVQITKENGRAEITNGNQPGGRQLPESARSDMEFFIAQLQLLLPTLGFDFLRAKPSIAPLASGCPASAHSPELPPGSSPSQGLPLFLNHESTGVSARAVELDGELTVLQGSLGTQKENAQNTYSGLRQSLIDQGKLRPVGDKVVFTEDVVFASASAAAAVINNRNSAGPREWKLENGLTLREWRDNLLDHV